MNSGIDGSSAGTALRASLLALNNPATAQGKIMDKLGFSVTDAAGEFKSLSVMIGDMQKATEHMTEADKVATLGKLVGTEAVSGFLALMKAGPAEINKMTDALVNSGGAAAETAKQMMGGLGGSLEEMSGAIETVAIRVGESLAPAIQVFADLVANTNFDPFINAVGLVGDAAGYVAKLVEDNWSKIGPVLAPIAKVVAAMAGSFLLIGGAGAVFMALSTVIGFISGPIAAVALGIGAVVGAFAVLYDKVAPFREKVTSVFDGLKVALGFEVETPNAPKVAGDTGATMLDEGNQTPQSVEYLTIAEQIKGAFQTINDAVSPVLESVSSGFTKVKDFAGVAVDFLKTKFAEIQPSLVPLVGIFSQVWGTVSSIFSSAWSIISPILGGLWDLLQIVGEYAVIMFNNVLVPALGFAAQAFSTLWSIASPILELIALGFELWMAAVKAVWENALAPFVEFLTTGVANAFNALSEGLGVIGGAFDWVSDKVGIVYDKIRDFAGMISNIELPSWVTDGISTVVNTVGNFIGAGKGDKADGSHYNGLLRVPANGYMAELHKDETVLPRFEADAYRSLLDGGGSLSSVMTQVAPQTAEPRQIGEHLVAQNSVTNVTEAVLPQLDLSPIATAFSTLVDVLSTKLGTSGVTNVDSGVSNVAYDNSSSVTNQYSYATYMAQQQSAAQQAPQQPSITVNPTITGNQFIVREDADVAKIGDAVADHIVSKILEKRGVTN